MRYLFFCALMLFSTVNFAQTRETTDTSIINSFADIANQRSPNDSLKFYVAKVKADHVIDFRRQFKEKIKRQIATNWFIIKARSSLLYHSPFIEKYFVANYRWKLSPTLLTNLNKLPPEKNFIFLVEADDSTSFIRELQKNWSQVIILSQHRHNLFRIRTNFDFLLKNLIDKNEVISIDLKLEEPMEESVVNDYDNSGNGINLFFAKYPSLRGDSLTVSVKENLFDTTDIDFKGRYKSIGGNSNQVTSHATTMATIIGGGGNSFYTGRGIGWGSTLSSSDFAVLLPDGNNVYQQYKISVQNHSYGVGVENFYGSDAGAYDQSMIDNSSLLHIFSAGNSGNLAPGDGQYSGITGFANITGSFKQAKNILVVGSLDSFYNVPLLSSKGPAYDGRIKPELVAYGNDGSSGAAAITSGTALVLQSAYMQQHNDSLPANALVKAILINSAEDVLNPGPDFYSGYGNVNTYRAVKDMLSGNFFSGTVQQDEIKDFKITIPTNAKNLKVSLVWDDVPAQTNAFTALVNDLDLQLEKSSDHTLWLPWVLNSDADVDSLNQLATRRRDSLNVVEQITIDDPLAGDYVIHVKGYDVSTPSPSFYVAYRCDTANRFQFISPARYDHFTSGGNSIFRWSDTYSNSTGKLEYSLDGINWNLINANVDLTKKYFKWITPDTFALAIVRMTIGADVYVSDTFNFSRQLYPTVGFNCSDSALIYWNKANGVSAYDVYQLGSKYLQPVSIVDDTSIVLHNAASSYVAVATVLQNNYEGVKSYTFNYTTQGVACYISNFLADLNVNNNALLQLTLGTIVNISYVQFQEFTPNGWNTINTIQTVANTALQYEDVTLHAGINTYRAVVTLIGGGIVYSNVASVYYFGNNTFVMMPNPLPRGQTLIILSNNSETSTLVIYDMIGRKVLQKELTESREDIPVSRLARGVYVVVISTAKEKLFTGKLIIE